MRDVGTIREENRNHERKGTHLQAFRVFPTSLNDRKYVMYSAYTTRVIETLAKVLPKSILLLYNFVETLTNFFLVYFTSKKLKFKSKYRLMVFLYHSYESRGFCTWIVGIKKFILGNISVVAHCYPVPKSQRRIQGRG